MDKRVQDFNNNNPQIGQGGSGQNFGPSQFQTNPMMGGGNVPFMNPYMTNMMPNMGMNMMNPYATNMNMMGGGFGTNFMPPTNTFGTQQQFIPPPSGGLGGNTMGTNNIL